jgi:hypothetical protein
LPFLEKFKNLIDAADSANQIIKSVDEIKSSLGSETKNLSNSSLAKATDIGKFTRIRITFNNIGVNTDFKLISGEIIASYDPSWKGIIDGDKLVEDISDFIDDFIELNFFGPNDDIPESTPKPENNTPIEGNNTPVVTNPTVTPPVVTSPPVVDNTTTPSTNPNPTNTSPVNTTAPTNTTTPAVVPPKANFKSISLIANEKGEKKRMAKEDQTLYYVRDLLKTPKTDLTLTINPPLSKDKIKDNVYWLRNDFPIDKSQGILKLTSKDLDKDATIKSIAGFPTEKTRIINVKFVDKNASAWSFVPPAVSQVLTKSFEEVDNKLKLLDKYVKISNHIKMKVDPIKINGSKYNENDKNSRLYKKMEVGSISGGLSAESKEKLITHPILQTLSRAGIVDVGLYYKGAFSIEVEGGVERYILVEQKNYNNNNPFLKIGPKGSFTFGLKAELKAARDQVKFDVRGAVEVGFKGDATFNFSNKKLVGEIYVPPAILFATVQIATKGYIEFELVDFQKSIELTDKVTLYEIEKQF